MNDMFLPYHEQKRLKLCLDKLLRERLSVKGGSPLRGLIELYRQSNGYII